MATKKRSTKKSKAAKKSTTRRASKKTKATRASKKSKGGKKKASKKTRATKRPTKSRRRPAARRELIDTRTDKRFVRRDPQGRFDESDDMGRSLSQDRRRKAKRTAKRGQGDKGDRKSA